MKIDLKRFISKKYDDTCIYGNITYKTLKTYISDITEFYLTYDSLKYGKNIFGTCINFYFPEFIIDPFYLFMIDDKYRLSYMCENVTDYYSIITDYKNLYGYFYDLDTDYSVLSILDFKSRHVTILRDLKEIKTAISNLDFVKDKILSILCFSEVYNE